MTEVKKIRKDYSLGEEISHSITHGIGAVLSLVYLVLLLVKGGETLEILAYIAFCFCSLMLYLSSTLYHCFKSGSKVRALFHRFDHVGIYLLIAGTYTPFTLLGIRGNLGIVLCIIVWTLAVTGIVLKVIYFSRFKILHLINYLALGWIGIFYIGTILENIGASGSLLLILGGVSYTIGFIFYSLKKIKYSHFVWHLFVLAGTLLHFLAIYNYL